MRLSLYQKEGFQRRIILLAPDSINPGPFQEFLVDSISHHSRLAEAQKLRGRIALAEGAVDPSELEADGRHVQAADQHSWHLLTLDGDGRIAACMRYLPHPNQVDFNDLTVSRSALAQSRIWGRQLRKAVEQDLRSARQRGCSYVELGGWVISEALRCTTEALRMIATAYAFAQMCGGALGVTTASTRRCSAAILKRIGGQRMQSRGVELPTYYDQHYRCQMEILRFDSSEPNPRYGKWMDACRSHLEDVQVICREAAGPRQFEEPAFAYKRKLPNLSLAAVADAAVS